VSFAKALKPDEPEAIRAYLVARAIELKKTAAAPAPPGPPPGAAPIPQHGE
jgi:hypothetical protein